ncbi:cellulose binding domain-containing protein [Saccharothrix isguenensis]
MRSARRGVASGATALTWAPANEQGFGTSKTLESKVRYTLRDGEVSEVHRPDLQSDRGSGFTAEITFTNTGTAQINEWVPAFSFSGDQPLAGGWSVHWSQSDQAVTVRNEGHNARIGPGDSVIIGWGNATVPTALTVDGTPA